VIVGGGRERRSGGGGRVAEGTNRERRESWRGQMRDEIESGGSERRWRESISTMERQRAGFGFQTCKWERVWVSDLQIGK